MGSMTGADWAIIILAAILVALLCTIGQWWSLLVLSVGLNVALIIVAVVIVALLVALIWLICANPDWLSNTIGQFADDASKLLNAATDQMANFMTKMMDALMGNFTTIIGIAGCVIGGVLIYNYFKGRQNDKIHENYNDRIGGVTREVHTNVGSGGERDDQRTEEDFNKSGFAAI